MFQSKIQDSTSKISPLSSFFQRCFVLTALFLYGLCLLLQLAVWEPYDLRVEHAEIAWEGWPADAAPVRAVLLADIHACAWEGEWVDRIVRETAAQKPNFILLLGDYPSAVDPRLSMPPQELAARLAPLRAVAPVFYVTGNHDVGKWMQQLHKGFADNGFINIERVTVRLSFDAGRLLDLRGAPFYGGSHRKYFPKDEPPGPPLLAVVHDPLDFMRLKLKTDAVVGGHTHGGQMCWPSGMAVKSPSFCYTLEMLRGGLRSAKAGQPLYVSRGLGSSVLPFRMNCPPEISVLELKGS